MASNQNIGRKATGSGWTAFLLMALITMCNGYLYSEKISIPDEEFASYFGPDGCIEGILAAMAITQPVPPLQDSTVTTCGAEECPPSSSTETQEKEPPQGSIDVSNIKEKTPMCMVNELARYNKIVHQYRLTGEQGPPHQKRFMVTLKLGEEEYSAEGASIKKAQHAAASYALKITDYEHPPPKASKNLRLSKGNITPTVELNALAMRRGEPTTYTIIEPTPMNFHQNYNYHHRGMYSQPRQFTNYNNEFSRRNSTTTSRTSQGVYNSRYDNQRTFGAKGGAPFRVSVKVGGREYQGEGVTAQAARHDAASKALDELRTLPVDTNRTVCKGFTVEEGDPAPVTLETDSSSELKSPISLVHELALKRNLNVNFEVVNEKGPPHMRTFVTRCRVGESFETTGEGNGKKVSKKRAAEKMLEELRTLPPTTIVTACGIPGSLSRMKRKPNATKKKSRNLIKVANPTIVNQDPKTEAEVVDEINPISRLIQIQQAKKEREPVYALKEERGLARRKEFFMEVTVGDFSYIGSGPNKKLAKRNAAEGLLQEMGYSSPASQPGFRKNNNFMNGEKPNVGGSGGRQLVPGLLLMTDNVRGTSNGNAPTRINPGAANLQATAALAKEYLNGGSASNQKDVRGSHMSGDSAQGVRPKDQLLYLAKLLGFSVQFSDFPKGNHSEFLSLVSLSTEPPHVCHGAGKTTDHSHDQAALTALRALAKMGLDTVAPMKKESMGSGGETLFGGGGGTNGGGNMAAAAVAGTVKASFVNGAPNK